jgi:hypothetical protein
MLRNLACTGLCSALLSVVAGTANAQVRPFTAPQVVQTEFEIRVAGNRQVIPLQVRRPGRVRVQIVWSGGADRLVATLNARGRNEPLARSEGGSPLVLEAELTEMQARSGDQWLLSLVAPGVGGTARGFILTESSATRPFGVRDRLVDPRTIGVGVAPAASDTVTTILADGTVEVRYPNGRIMRRGIGAGCWDVIDPNQPPQRYCAAGVIRAKLADLPAGLLSQSLLNTWLQDLSPHLLDAIRTILRNEEAYETYLGFEGTRSLPEQIDLRLRLLNQLLGSE